MKTLKINMKLSIHVVTMTEKSWKHCAKGEITIYDLFLFLPQYLDSRLQQMNGETLHADYLLTAYTSCGINPFPHIDAI